MADSIGFDPAAWSIDGARISSDLMRVLAYAGTSGSEGIVSPGDCKVHQLPQAGPQIAVDPGAIIARNRSAGVRNQSYVANGRTESRLDVTSTGPEGERSDLVVVRFEDPQFAPWEKPAEAEAPDFQYVRPFIIQNVPPTTTKAQQLGLGYSAVALARLDIPANTAAITDAMIKPLRELAQPLFKPELLTNTGADAGNLTSVTWADWPNWKPQVTVPEWATWISVVCHLSGVGINGYVDGELRIHVGDQILPGVLYYDRDQPSTNGPGEQQRVDLTVASSGFLTADQAGSVITLKTQGWRYDYRPAFLFADARTSLAWDILFSQRAV